MSTSQMINVDLHKSKQLADGKKTNGHLCSDKLKFVLGSVVVLAVVALFAAVCAIATVLSVSRSNSTPVAGDTVANLEKKAAMFNELVRSRRSERGRASMQGRRMGSNNRENSCYSLMTNDSHPAAHITGTGGQGTKWNVRNMPSPSNPDPSVSADAWGYQSHWMCTERRGAFVDGGMYFNQTDKKLYVPKCGYYYVSSQMYFDYIQTAKQQFVLHQLTVERNCGEEEDTLQLESISSLGETNKMSKTSTFLGDIVQICAGGKISMNVPVKEDRSPCCPGGMDTITYFSAYLMKEMKCEWSKARMLTNPPTQQDYDHYYNTHQ